MPPQVNPGMLETASNLDIKRLLELFPIHNLKQGWPDLKGSKDEMCVSIAESRDYPKILDFVYNNISCCRQHVHIFTHGPNLTSLPTTVEDGAKVYELEGAHAVFLARFRYSVVLREPLEETTLDFLWPIRVELTTDYLVVRFVVLQKNLGSYFDRQFYVGGKNIDESSVIQLMVNSDLAQYADIHKGIKALWDAGFMDSKNTRYKKPFSTASEEMDGELGIREHNPELYEIIMDSPLYNTTFIVGSDKGTTVTALSADPSRGYLAFPRYSERIGDTDHVIGEIIRLNQ